jgi:hypothetical protein
MLYSIFPKNTDDIVAIPVIRTELIILNPDNKYIINAINIKK